MTQNIPKVTFAFREGDDSTGRPPINSLYFEWTETLQEQTWGLLKESIVTNRNVWEYPKLTKEDKI